MAGLALSSPLVVVGALLAVDVLLYAALGIALLRRRARRVNAKNLAEAFKGLEMALKQAAPDLPAGFTWGEALARLRSVGVNTGGMENALKGYEGYRYGTKPLPDVDYREVVTVANMLGGINTRKGGTSTLGQ